MPAFSVARYLSTFDEFLDLRRFAGTPRTANKLTVFDTPNRKEHNATSGAWFHRWRLWGRKGASTKSCTSDEVDLQIILCYW